MLERRVRYTWRARLGVLALLGFVLGFAGAFAAIGLRAGSGWGRWLPVAIAAAFLVAVFVSPAGAFFVRASRPAFTTGAEGVRRHDGVLLPWEALRGAVLFDSQGEEHLGLQLKEGVASLAGRPLADVFERDLDWRAHGMPLVTMTRVLAISTEDLLALFEAHGIRVVREQDAPEPEP